MLRFEHVIEKLKRSLLRIEKNFGQNINEPLKKAMINKKHTRNPNSHWTCKSPQRGDLDSLSNMVRRNRGSLHHSKMRVLLAIHTESLYTDNGVATEGWREALELNEKIDDLLSRASAIGWERREDPNFVRLQLDSAIDRANGPSSVIAYLEVVLDSRMVGGMNSSNCRPFMVSQFASSL